MSSVKENSRKIEQMLNLSLEKSNRKRSDVQVIAVTKSVSSEQALAAIEEGYDHLAENRPEGLDLKQKELNDQRLVWHFIGNLQTRKVKKVINKIDYFHALDRLSLAEEIEKRAEKSVSCFVQVNVTGEETKSGISPNQLDDFIKSLSQYSKIKVVGLMTIAPLNASETVIRSAFVVLRKLQESIKDKALPYAPCTELSMGMSKDYTIAVEEGATFVRIGTSFFE
ncbi:YggS family pyridoxal phosphate-dependent enzyme [Carnobacterium pleistocenium]|uniref:YggS family pyridoxal phosphate-dependent enzyme n=1 Tax=Carnobacterium pleistocenium TaxID=181073 RepID=UPI0005588889|nr:YggS family pyridoxal phosphate-dependent enzyme [Carnobacterium pleistocenium]